MSESTKNKNENDDEKEEEEGEAPAVSRKRKRASYGLDVKLHVIKQKKENGQRVVDIARALGIPETTIRTMLKNSAEIEAKATTTPRNSEANITRMRSDVMEMMERKLCVWIEDLYLQKTPVSLSLIRTKALSLYDDIQKEMGDRDDSSSKKKPKEFSASKGWFHRFQKRYGFKNVKMQQGSSATASVVDLRRTHPKTYVSKKKTAKPSFKISKDKPSDVDRFLEDVVDDDVHRLLDSNSLPLTNEQLEALNQTSVVEEASTTTTGEVSAKTSNSNSKKDFTVDNLRTTFAKLDEAVQFFKEHDPESDRSTKFERGLEKLLSCYRTVLFEKLREGDQVTFDSLLLQQKLSKEPYQLDSGTSR